MGHKLKTNSGAKKRFKITARGKVKRAKAFHSHSHEQGRFPTAAEEISEISKGILGTAEECVDCCQASH